MRPIMKGLAAAFATCLVAGSAMASDLQLGIEAFAGLNSYRMRDLNEEVKGFNEGLGTDFKLIQRGIGQGVGLRVWAAPTWFVSAAVEPIYALTESNLEGADSTGLAFSSYVGLNLDAHSFQIGGGYVVPTASRSIKLGLLGGIGYYRVHGKYKEVVVDTEEVVVQTGIKGSAVGVHAGVTIERSFNSKFALALAALYRRAKVRNLRDDDGDKVDLTADYSGLISRIGVIWYPFEHEK